MEPKLSAEYIRITEIPYSSVREEDWCNSNNHKYWELPPNGQKLEKELDLESYKDTLNLTRYDTFAHLITATAVNRLRIELTPLEVSLLFEASRISIIRGSISKLHSESLERIIERLQKTYFDHSSIRYFVRLDDCSPKDSPLSIGPFTDAHSIISSIVCSCRCMKSLRWADHKDTGRILWCIPWRDDIHVSNEFRCFIRNRKLAAMSQYCWHSIMNWKGKESILRYIAIQTQKLAIDTAANIKIDDFVLDIHVKVNTDDCKTDSDRPVEVEMVELNSFGAQCASGAACFHWIRDFEQMYGFNESTEIRIVVTDDEYNQSSLNKHNWNEIQTF